MSARFEEALSLVTRLAAANNPVAQPLLATLESGVTAEDVEAVIAVATAQAARVLHADEKEQSPVTVLYPMDDSQLAEIAISGVRTWKDLRQALARRINYPADSLVLKYRGTVVEHTLDDDLLDITAAPVTACRTSTAMNLGLIDFESPDPGSLSVQVNVPMQEDVYEVLLEALDRNTDIGEIRELIAGQLDIDSNVMILKSRGVFLLPSDDLRTLGELFPEAVSGSSLQMTAYPKDEAVKLGQMNDYTYQLVQSQKSTLSPSQRLNALPVPFALNLVSPRDTPRAHREVDDFVKGLVDKHAEEVPETVVPGAPVPPPPPSAPEFVPGMMIPPPPPAPPVRSRRISEASLCRAFHWEKSVVTNGSIWNHMNSSTDTIDTTALELLFAKKTRKVKVTKLGGPGAPATTTNTCGPLRLQDEARIQNLEIMLKQLPELSVLHSGILTLDEELLSRETLALMFQNVPSAEELEFTLRSVGEETSLETADTSFLYVHMLATTPGWKTRLASWKATLEFPDRVADLSGSLTRYSSALSLVHESPALRHICRVVLQCGNVMNKGTRKGGAVGFRIDSLLKLRSTKQTSSRGGSLLDFVVRQLRDSAPSALQFSSDLRTAHEGISKLSLETLHRELYAVLGDTKTCLETAVRLGETLTEASDPFHGIVCTLEEQFESINALVSVYEGIEATGRSLLEYFGLSLASATKLYMDIYPPDLAEQKKRDKQQLGDRREWEEDQLVELTAVVRTAFSARAEHRETQGSVLPRQKAVTEAMRALESWVDVLATDLEGLKGSGGSSELVLLSDAVRNTFRLLLEFSGGFSEAVYNLMNPPRAPRTLRITRKVKPRPMGELEPGESIGDLEPLA